MVEQIAASTVLLMRLWHLIVIKVVSKAIGLMRVNNVAKQLVVAVTLCVNRDIITMKIWKRVNQAQGD